MTSETLTVQGSIVDSWLEKRTAWRPESRIVLQVAPRGSREDLWIIEAAPSLLPDDAWVADLGENLCHGSPVAIVGRVDAGGNVKATSVHIER